MATRRSFIAKSTQGLFALCLPKTVLDFSMNIENPKLSLAQWSLHRALQKGELKAHDFPKVSLEDFGIPAVEYVNQFYMNKARDTAYWKSLAAGTRDMGVTNVLIMVDSEGDLGDPKNNKRMAAVDNHMKWVEAARILGCHSIRVNAFGKGKPEQLKAALVDGLGELAARAWEQGIYVLIENHGLHTSDARFMVDIITEVDHPGLGTLPDFGNWCLNKEWGSTMGAACTENYGPVSGLKDFLPFAQGVSAKTYAFDAEGNETILPYKELLSLVKASGFDGHIGIEYEGSELSEAAGIRATRDLVTRVWADLD
ncbi:Sugar phosphate isomerase/epimerase [Robiginitalea myxolifaciens]|uniref:Sugar phosphate isomerase/epimerase n=1 Tax=Robiginitalea myxolifaciens TaxID=400055 RepID=A0A1I6FMV9_9FLAO|nr:sugar phosphate isomerase/epimerase family protein [Robiginitalea myxolifaciens]SFR31279.1 Sugar phosphate isomerase/epimerase [Robiginitalea myxolifaciens]